MVVVKERVLAAVTREVEPDFQASLVEDMSDERVADLLEEMAPDEAADILAELGEDRSKDLLNLMEKDEAADIRTTLTSTENSVGGIMTTEYVAVRPDLTALQAMAFLRKVGAEAETINYVYVTGRNDRTHRRILAARPGVGTSADPVTENSAQTHCHSQSAGQTRMTPRMPWPSTTCWPCRW